jgi:hypothetical protein
MTRAFESWRHLADCNILWRTTDDMTERNALLDKVAAKCVELEAEGGPASIWHAHALILGTPCQCVACNPRPARR